MNKVGNTWQKHFVEPGMTFGSWEVISESPGCVYLHKGRRSRRRHFLCLCVCGTKRNVSLNNLLNGKSTSCGCYRREVRRESYLAWRNSFGSELAFSRHLSELVRAGLDKKWRNMYHDCIPQEMETNYDETPRRTRTNEFGS